MQWGCTLCGGGQMNPAKSFVGEGCAWDNHVPQYTAGSKARCNTTGTASPTAASLLGTQHYPVAGASECFVGQPCACHPAPDEAAYARHLWRRLRRKTDKLISYQDHRMCS